MPALSMLASTGAYAFFYGWPFAAGMVGLIFVHELGHLAAMRALGIPAGPITFIPFLGASIEMQERPKDVRDEAVVAFGGPVLGGAAAVALSGYGVATGSQMLIALADFGIMINLFNLLPLGSLDGGRIGGAISRWTLVAGLAGGTAMLINGHIHNPIFVLILFSGAFSAYDRFFGEGTHDSYYRISLAQRAALTALYAALIAALMLAMAWNQQHKKSLRTIKRENNTDHGSEYGRKLEALAEEWQEHAQDDAEKRFFEGHFGQRDSFQDR
jgi:Zn-dependent protease